MARNVGISLLTVRITTQRMTKGKWKIRWMKKHGSWHGKLIIRSMSTSRTFELKNAFKLKIVIMGVWRVKTALWPVSPLCFASETTR